jgi:uncharacterized protein YndB with AHSA1/START domain
MTRAFEVAREVDLPAAPDDVWTAITADTAAWQFPTGMEIPAGSSPPEGAPITTWDPPHRLVVRMEAPDGTFNALDYLHTLGQYLEHFNGRAVTYVGQPSAGIEGPAAAGTPDAMDRLRAALGIADDAAVGDAVHADLGGAGALDGVIDYLTPEFIGVRDDDGLWRFFGRNHYGGVVGMSAHVFRDDVDAAAAEAALKAWLDSVYVSAHAGK